MEFGIGLIHLGIYIKISYTFSCAFFCFININGVFYFIALIIDAKTKPPIGEIISLILSIVIERSPTFIMEKWYSWKKSSFETINVHRFLYDYKCKGILITYIVLQLFFCFMVMFYCS